jgi:hypothetical protein
MIDSPICLFWVKACSRLSVARTPSVAVVIAQLHPVA